MTRYATWPKTRMDFLRNLYDNYEKQLSDTGLDDLKAATKKAVYKKKSLMKLKNKNLSLMKIQEMLEA